MRTSPFDIAADLDTPVSAFKKLAPFRPRFLLESVDGGQRLGRYSFIGFGEALSLRLQGGVATLKTLDGVVHTQPIPDTPAGVLGLLRTARAAAPHPGPALPGVPFQGGLVGVTGYDLVRRLERIRRPRPAHLTEPDTLEAAYVAPRSVLVFDHLTRRAALLHEGSEADQAALRAEVVAALRGPLPASPRAGRVGLMQPSLSRGDYEDRVRTAQEAIRAGEVFQLVLSIRHEGETDLAPFEVYRALRQLNPSPYLYYIDLDGIEVVGSSPEALVKLQGRQATLQPIAGTRPRGEDEAGDDRLAAELLGDAKETAEHVMLVDLARNDLGRVAVPGTVRVTPFRAIHRFSHVMHTVSGVTAQLAPGRDELDLFAAAFPAGTLVGAPKIRAVELIEELEPVGRGIYGGTVGYFGHPIDTVGAGQGARMDQAIAIRPLVFREGRAITQAGAGIVADSVPHLEHAECLAKAAALRAALQLAQEGL